VFIRGQGILKSPHLQLGDVVYLHGLFHHKRLAVLDADQISVEAGDRGEPFANLGFVREEVPALRRRSILRR
jgi:hypothetical protein